MEKAKVGYSTYEDTRNFDASNGKLKGLIYPCIILDLHDNSYPMSKFEVLQSMFTGTTIDLNGVEPISIFTDSGQISLIGKISDRQVKDFIKLFGAEKLSGYYAEGKALVGEELYVLSI